MLASVPRVGPRGKTPFLASLLAAAVVAIPGAAAGQVSAPRLVEDDVEAPAEPVRPPSRRGEGERRPAERPTPAAEPAAAPVEPPQPPAAAATGPAAPGAAGALPAPPPPPTTAAELARRIVPVQASWARIEEAWHERRRAFREADRARAEVVEREMLAAKRELAIANLMAFSAAEVREALRALGANLHAEALARAGVAVELAPDNPDAHLALARARFAAAPGEPGAALAALAGAFGAAAREPHTVRAFQGDLASAGLAALVTAAVATLLLLFLRRARLFIHDFHHLPLVRSAAFVQAAFLAVVLLGTPLAFDLGPVAFAAAALLAVWFHLSLPERAVGTAALLALAAVPFATGAAARLTAWTGTLAEQVYELEQGGVSDERAAEIAARWEGAAAPPALLAALGRHHKRRGHLDEALRHYRLAAAGDDRAPELQVNIGNVHFLQGDIEAAKAAYLAATDRAGGDLVVLGAAHYDLSKLYLRTSDMEKSAAAREMAEREAGAFLRRFGSDDDFSANLYLVDVPVPEEKIRALASAGGGAGDVAEWVGRRLSGSLPRGALEWGTGVFLVLLWLGALAGGRLQPASACERCGRPACRRCDAAAGVSCGQCVNVFQRKGVVEARDRLRKEAQVRRHGQFRAVTTRILALAAGGAGHVWSGAPVRGSLLLLALLFAGFVVWFWRGVLPPPQPSGYVLAAKIAVALPVAIAIWAYAVRDAFRRTE